MVGITPVLSPSSAPAKVLETKTLAELDRLKREAAFADSPQGQAMRKEVVELMKQWSTASAAEQTKIEERAAALLEQIR